MLETAKGTAANLGVHVRTSVLVIAASALPLLTLHPLQNVPYIDDWLYAWSVENFLNTGTLKILDYSNSVDVAQILWGVLFCLPVGFSFEALRLSTWVLSAFGLIGFYLLLLELGVSRRDSLIGVAILGFSPLYFLLSFTFMTDIPAITFNVWSLFCFIKYLNSGRDRWIFAASAFSILTIATRLPGLAIPGAIAAFLLFHKTSGIRKLPAVLVGVIVPVLCGIALIYWHSRHIEYRTDLTWLNGSPQMRTANLRFGVIYFPQWLLVTLIYALPAFGVLVAPLAISCPARRHYQKILVALAAVIAVAAIGFLTGVASPSYHGANRFLADMGGSYLQVPGSVKQSPSFVWNLLAGAVGLVLFCLAVGPTLSRRMGTGVVMLRWLLITQLVFVVVLSLWFSRYLLPLLPTILALILAATPVRRPVWALALIGLSAVISVGVLHDDIQYNRALWLSVDYLQETGAPWPRVHGGYIVNGWLQYAHKENAKVNGKGDVQVEWINAETEDFDYQISNKVEAGWLKLKEFRYGAWFGGAGTLHVLQRQPH
jgi:Dolichyl-phosphate-mannose-protein mannosyltransferase